MVDALEEHLDLCRRGPEIESSKRALDFEHVDQEVVDRVRRRFLGCDGGVLRVEKIENRHGAQRISVRHEIQITSRGLGGIPRELDSGVGRAGGMERRAKRLLDALGNRLPLKPKLREPLGVLPVKGGTVTAREERERQIHAERPVRVVGRGELELRKKGY